MTRDDDAATGRAQTDAVAEFAGGLRALRTAAGAPSFRHLAKVCNYSSSTLAEATAGRRLPSEAVVKAFVQACGGDPAEWLAKLAAASRAAAVGPAPAGPDDDNANDNDNNANARTSRPPARRSVVTAAAVAAVAGLAVGAVGMSLVRPSARPGAAAPGPGQSIVTSIPTSAPTADGLDPAAAGCAKDAELVDKSPVMIDGTQAGAVELLFSHACGAGWARIYLYPGRPTMLGEVTVRAADGRAASFSNPLVKQVPVYTNIIVPGAGGCLGAHAVFDEVGKAPASADITCQAAR